MKIILCLFMLMIYSCDDGNCGSTLLGDDSCDTVSESDQFDSADVCDGDALSCSWVFVANEGNYGQANGTVSMISDNGEVYSTDIIGQTVQSLQVYDDKLLVLINGDSKLKIYDITTSGLSMPGIEIDLNNSSPREMTIVGDKLYFTNWNTQDVKVFNLFNYSIEAQIPVQGLPEDIEFDGQYLWVTIPHSDSYFTTGTTVCKIDPLSNELVETIEVGDGPQQIAIDDNEIFISRTFYDINWSAFHGASKINGNEVSVNAYGSGAPCGGSIIKHNSSMMRSSGGGLAIMDNELNLLPVSIGNFDQSLIYHIEKIDGYFWFALTDYEDFNEVHVLNDSGDTIDIYQVGISPGDFAYWPNSD